MCIYIYIILFVNMYKCLRNTCIDLRLDYISLLKKKKNWNSRIQPSITKWRCLMGSMAIVCVSGETGVFLGLWFFFFFFSIFMCGQQLASIREKWGSNIVVACIHRWLIPSWELRPNVPFNLLIKWVAPQGET